MLLRLRLLVLGLVVFAASVGSSALAQTIPPRPPPSEGLVIDRANLLSPAERQSLNQRLIAFDDSTSNQIVVVILPTLDGGDPNMVATEIGQQWGVGQGGKDNGVVFLVSTGDRQVYIATGFGLEGAIPDAIAGRIIRRIVVPSFRQGQFYAGIAGAVDALMAAAAGEYTADPIQEPGDGFDLAFLVILFIVMMFLVSAARRNNGGGDGGQVRRRSGVPPVIIFPGGWGGGRRGGGFGGGFGGGGFGGGGFGGFGGGGFGGGGAGGGW